MLTLGLHTSTNSYFLTGLAPSLWPSPYGSMSCRRSAVISGVVAAGNAISVRWPIERRSYYRMLGATIVTSTIMGDVAEPRFGCTRTTAYNWVGGFGVSG